MGFLTGLQLRWERRSNNNEIYREDVDCFSEEEDDMR